MVKSLMKGAMFEVMREQVVGIHVCLIYNTGFSPEEEGVAAGFAGEVAGEKRCVNLSLMNA